MSKQGEAARRLMVETQVRTSDVTDVRLQSALRAIPREHFVPTAKADLAYSDLEPEVAPGRSLLRPRDAAKLLQAVTPQPHETALELSGATGYLAAVLSRLVSAVVTQDPDPALSLRARQALDAAGLSKVVAVCTETALGWPDAAPYDVIVLNGAAEFVPEAWLDQLAEGGRLAVIVRDGPAGSARIYTKTGGVGAYRIAFDASPPIAPGLARPKRFTF